MIVKNKELASTPCGERVSRKILGAAGKLMMVEVSFDKGAVGAPHSHPHEQMTCVLKGSFDIDMGGEKGRVRQGDVFYAAPDVVHSVRALEESVLLDVFTPQREDFLKSASQERSED